MCLFLFILWLILNGAVTPEIIVIGLLASAAIGVLSHFLMDYSLKRELLILKCVPLFLVYVILLIKEIIKASNSVLYIILNPRRAVNQSIAVVETGLRTGFARFMLANSITLTPGTITVKTDGSRFTVHCLSSEMIDGIESGDLAMILRKMESVIS